MDFTLTVPPLYFTDHPLPHEPPSSRRFSIVELNRCGSLYIPSLNLDLEFPIAYWFGSENIL